jgi:hypothetical protein
LGTSDGGYAQVISLSNKAVISHTISQAVATDPVKPQVMCLKFWVYFSVPITNLTNSLSVTLNRTSLGTFETNYYTQNQWLYMRLSFFGANKNVIAFTGITHSQDHVIAIDDINIIGRKCESVGACDFESGKNNP